MRKLYYFLAFFLLLATNKANAQTYADDVAAIIFDKCTKCHHTGGVGPFPLMTYTQVANKSTWIQPAITTGEMPPWPPNSNYSHFVHDRSLSAAQIQTINNWINNGMPQGNAINTPAAPIYTNAPKLGTPDLSVRIPNYISKATTSSDDYVCFSIPSGLTNNRIIRAIEVIPGNSSILHHCLVYLDPSGTYPTDTTSHGCTGPSSNTIPLIAGYAPGTDPVPFPNDPLLKLGVNMQSGSNIIFAMHYPEGSQGIMDSTRINIHFYPLGTAGVRQVSAGPVLGDFNFTINANTIDSVDSYYPNATTGIPIPVSVYGIFPHAHLLGKSFIVYAVNNTAPYDRIPLIHIPEWDFEWQGFYVFKNLQKIPVGYKIYGKALYDNTTNNHHNPNSPPQNVSFGLNTSDEMFLVYLQFTPYQAGDENINVDSLINNQLNITATPTPLASRKNNIFFTSYPNPSNTITTLHYYSPKSQNISLGIYDLNGKLVRQLLTNKKQKGEQLVNWDGKNSNGSLVPDGLYISRLQIGNNVVSQKLSRVNP